jgi:FAR-17a/AIG1-like protein
LDVFKVLQGFYHLIALINDFFGTSEPCPRDYPFIRSLKDYIFAALAFPTAAYVSLIFWCLCLVDRDLILPAKYSEIFPWWLNQIVHTNVLVWMIAEHYFSCYRWQNMRLEIISLAVWSILYFIWVFVIKHFAGVWIYPFMAVLSVTELILFFAVALVIPFACYFSGRYINRQIWSKYDHGKVQ